METIMIVLIIVAVAFFLATILSQVYIIRQANAKIKWFERQYDRDRVEIKDLQDRLMAKTFTDYKAWADKLNTLPEGSPPEEIELAPGTTTDDYNENLVGTVAGKEVPK